MKNRLVPQGTLNLVQCLTLNIQSVRLNQVCHVGRFNLRDWTSSAMWVCSQLGPPILNIFSWGPVVQPVRWGGEELSPSLAFLPPPCTYIWVMYLKKHWKIWLYQTRFEVAFQTWFNVTDWTRFKVPCPTGLLSIIPPPADDILHGFYEDVPGKILQHNHNSLNLNSTCIIIVGDGQPHHDYTVMVLWHI
jgi:hypothetical protein